LQIAELAPPACNLQSAICNLQSEKVMASPYQQQALRRKLIYLGLIVGLFTASGIFRAYVVEARAEELALREQNVGEVEVGGSALQLSLTGSRGFVVCALWYWATDAQKKNKWNELELYVDSLTRLQPHFISPWLFQSWNLAYNVSVEADQVKDKYFYVSRGVQLLVKGERKNHNQPDLRSNIGFYQQHKIMQSDETNVYRCLYQMSCIPPPERDPARFWKEVDGRKTINLVAFEKFCAEHPQLVRRLHDRLRCGKPENVVRFLEDNNRIPSLYVDDRNEAGPEWAQGRTPLKPLLDRFPALPPPADARVRRDELPILGVDKSGELIRAESYGSDLSYERVPDDGIDGYAGARAWYGYAQEALPEPHPTIPGASAPIVDRTRQRKSKMTVNLFRNHPPRAQSYLAERLQDEGWFGPDPTSDNPGEREGGWLITGWFPERSFKLTDRSLASLREAELPQAVLAKLSTLKDKEFDTSDAFLADLARVLDKEELERFKGPVLKDLASIPADHFQDGREARVGTGTHWGEESWRKANEMWERRGRRSLMLIDPQRLVELRALAAPYLKSRNVQMGMAPPSQEPAEDHPDHEAWAAARVLFELEYSQRLTNFKHFYYRSLVEMEPEKEKDDHSLLAARRTLFQARQNVRQGRRAPAVELFESKSGLERLRLVFELHPELREDPFTQEEFYELELRYIKLMQEKDGGKFKQYALAGNLLAAGLPQGPAPAWAALCQLELTDPSLLANMPVPEFVPGYTNLLQDEVECNKYQRLVALGNLIGTPAAPFPAPLVAGSLYLLSPFKDPPPGSKERAEKTFVPRGLMRIEAPSEATSRNLVNAYVTIVLQSQPFAGAASSSYFLTVTEDHKPFVDPLIVMQVKARHGLIKPASRPSGPPGMPGMPQGMPPPGGAAPPR